MSKFEHRPVVVLADRPIVVARENFVLRSDGLYELVGIPGEVGPPGPQGVPGSVVRVERVVPMQSTVQSGHGRDGALPPVAKPSKGTAAPPDPRKEPVKTAWKHNPNRDGRLIGLKPVGSPPPSGWASYYSR